MSFCGLVEKLREDAGRQRWCSDVPDRQTVSGNHPTSMWGFRGDCLLVQMLIYCNQLGYCLTGDSGQLLSRVASLFALCCIYYTRPLVTLSVTTNLYQYISTHLYTGGHTQDLSLCSHFKDTSLEHKSPTLIRRTWTRLLHIWDMVRTFTSI